MTDGVPVAVVGVGRIGAALVGRLTAAGHPVVAHDVRPDRREVVEPYGATWAADVATAVAGATVVFTAVDGAPELEQLVVTSDGLVPHLTSGACWVDLTSASYEVSRACSAVATARGVDHLDAPLGGGVDAVTHGTATLYVGGDPATLERVRPVLATFAATVHHAGGHGTGHLVKLLVNTLWFGQVALVAETLLVAERHGVPGARFWELLTGSAGDSVVVQRYLPALLAGDRLPHFGLDRCVEELAAVEATATAAGLPHPVTTAVVDLHRAALHRFGAVDGELLGAVWLQGQAARNADAGG